MRVREDLHGQSELNLRMFGLVNIRGLHHLHQMIHVYKPRMQWKPCRRRIFNNGIREVGEGAGGTSELNSKLFPRRRNGKFEERGVINFRGGELGHVLERCGGGVFTFPQPRRVKTSLAVLDRRRTCFDKPERHEGPSGSD